MVKLIRGTPAQDTILGTQDTDDIQAGAGSDFIYGFLGADTINGGTGYDTLFITGTSRDLNIATDAQLVSVEEVSAKLASGGITINLAMQSEGFILTGSAYMDVLAGGTGANYIDAGNGDDVIAGFGASDTVIGGLGADTLILTSSINTATDIQISGIENILASGANKGLTINLGNQSERYFLVGSGFNDEITGGSGSEVINSGAGDDKIYGYLGNDYVNGGDGADTLILGKTSAYLNAALDLQLISIETVSAAKALSGVNIDLSVQSESFTIIGSNQSDTLRGGGGDDTFVGTSGLDTIDGGFGADKLLLTSDLNNVTNAQLVNIETVSAAAASQGVIINLLAQSERLTITGSAYADTLAGGVAMDIISAGNGDDVIKGFVNADSVDGGGGFDTLVLTATSTNLNTVDDDHLTNVEAVTASTSSAGVTINLSAQSESFAITGTSYPDLLIGGSGADVFFGFNGIDSLNGDKGTDTLVIMATSTNLNGATDSQLVNIEAVSASVATSGVTISLINQTEAFSFTGSNYADQLRGTVQDDTFNGFKGADTIDGGAGSDILKLTSTSADLNRASNSQLVNLEKVSAATATSGLLIDLSNQTERIDILGSAFDDTLVGGGGTINGGDGQDILYIQTDITTAPNGQFTNIESISAARATKGLTVNLASQTENLSIIGGAYNDTLAGGYGGDELIGGSGSDMLMGGAGADAFVFNKPAASNGIDTIVDFTPGVDMLKFSLTEYGGLVDLGPLAAVKFWASPTDFTSHAAEDRFIYNTTAGLLFYDADGLGGVDAIQIAAFLNREQLSSADFLAI